MQNLPSTRRRTAAIVILAVVAAVAGVYAVFDIFRFLGFRPIAQLDGMSFYTVSWLGALFAGILALIWFTTAVRLWNLDPQGWLFVVVVATLDIILLLFSWMGGSSFQAVLPGLVIAAIALILGLLPSTKAAFGMPATAAKR